MAAYDPFAPSAGSGEAPLPPGWVEHTDVTTGKSYFANQFNGETSWTRPAVKAVAAAAAKPAEVLRKPSWDEASANERIVRVPDSEVTARTAAPCVKAADGPVSLGSLLLGKLHGECLARVSARTLLMKEWKPCFWVFDAPNTLLVFRERQHYLDYKANPYMSKEEKEYLVKKRLDLGPNFKIHPITQKAYGVMSETMVYHFTVEEMKDYGPAVAVKFGAPASATLEDLRVFLLDAVKIARTAR